jgi:peptidoglycan-N-acetylglucosamine deacetylase
MAAAVAKRGMLITTSWDDGHPLDFRISELLAKHGLPGTFYVPLRNMRPTISPAQIRELSQSFEIGAHTVSHVRLTEVDARRAKAEIVDCKRQLEDIVGRRCSIFCFPGGSYTAAHLTMLRDAGFEAVRTVELLSLERSRRKQGITIIPTSIQAYSHDYLSYFRNVGKRVSIRGFANLLLCRVARPWSSLARALLERAVAHGGVFHLWGHSWEIEERGEWEALSRVLALIAEYKNRALLAPNGGLYGNE